MRHENDHLVHRWPSTKPGFSEWFCFHELVTKTPCIEEHLKDLYMTVIEEDHSRYDVFRDGDDIWTTVIHKRSDPRRYAGAGASSWNWGQFWSSEVDQSASEVESLFDEEVEAVDKAWWDPYVCEVKEHQDNDELLMEEEHMEEEHKRKKPWL